MTPRAKRERIVDDLRNEEFRRAFVESLIADRIPAQIREMRLSRGWNQEELGRRAGMKQSRINLLERMDQPFVSVRTLTRIASAFDVGLKVRFVPFSELADDFASPSTADLDVPSFDQDAALFEPMAWNTESVVYFGTNLTLDQHTANTWWSRLSFEQDAPELIRPSEMETWSNERAVLHKSGR
jgi:transcriptional regulator with XRE-family HTH domain